ncbi:MAG: hypothetical protein N2260_06920 [Syntrophobacterales bacterium]|nr:hypothetical protein [Syntrophobacterales bacterium]
MKCPKCNYISFDYLENCKKCGAVLTDIKSELCPLELPPKMSLWEWLGLGTEKDKIDHVSTFVTQTTKELEEPPVLEISLYDQREEIIIDDEGLIELDIEKVSEEEQSQELTVMDDSEALDTLDLDRGEELTISETLEDQKLKEILESYDEIGKLEIEAEIPTLADKSLLDEKPPIEVSIGKPLEISAEGGEIQVREPSKWALDDEEDGSIDSLLQELDEVLGEEEEDKPRS